MNTQTTRQRYARNREIRFEKGRENSAFSGMRTRTWTGPKSNTYRFNDPVNNNLAWRFGAYILECWAYGKSHKATRSEFLMNNPHLNTFDNDKYANDFFSAAKHAGLVTEVCRNDNGEIIYQIGPNYPAFAQGKLQRI